MDSGFCWSYRCLRKGTWVWTLGLGGLGARQSTGGDNGVQKKCVGRSTIGLLGSIWRHIFEDIFRNQHSCDQRARARSLGDNTASLPSSLLPLSLSCSLKTKIEKGEKSHRETNSYINPPIAHKLGNSSSLDHSSLPRACTGQKSSVYGVCSN